MTETVTREPRLIVAGRGAAPGSRRRLASSDLAIRAASVLVVLVAWEVLGPNVNRLILRPPSQIAASVNSDTTQFKSWASQALA